MRALVICALIFIPLLPNAAHAADSSSGCGPGWYILKDKSLISSFGRAITHGILSPFVTLGMTFGTSNCGKHSIVENDKESLRFASENFDILRQDIVRGYGEHLTSYVTTFGCKDSSVTKISTSLKKGYQRYLHGSQEPVDYVIETKRIISSNEELKTSCS